MKKSDLLILGPQNAKNCFIFAHGSGAPMDCDWMNHFSESLAANDIKVVRFEFPYMHERRKRGSKRPPNKPQELLNCFKTVIDLVGHNTNLYIGGKSMGGRIASMLADEVKPAGLICLGYPFHAPGKEVNDSRLTHLKHLKTRALIIQGSRDKMGNESDIKNYELSKKIKMHWLEDGDHSFKPRKKSGLNLDQHIEDATRIIAKFIK